MPKGKRKGKSDRYIGSNQTSGSDDDSVLDNASVFSGHSELQSIDGDAEEVDETSAQEAFEEKLMEALDGLTQKSSQGRTTCFEGICNAFIKKYISDFCYDRRMTLSDGIERSLKKGKGAEQAAAAQLAPLLCVQLGSGDASEEVCSALKPVLLVTANDNSVTPAARAKCCTALGLITFLSGGEMGEVLELMQQLQTIFAGSYLKGDKSVPNITAELGVLHAAAISSWTLLFTLMSSGDVYSLLGGGRNFTPSIDQLSELLLSSHLDVRLSAGEALATVFELGRECHDDFAEELIPDLVDTLKQLATDSAKYRAKKERKQQRATFRDILNYIENDQFSEIQIKFGREVLILDSWTRRKQYDSICMVLGSGLNTHLTENELVRDIFELGGRLIVDELTSNDKKSKFERHLRNAAAFKARSITRGKNRDKRSDF